MRYILLIEMSKQFQVWVTDALNNYGLDPNHYADKFIGVMEKKPLQLEEYLDSCLSLKYSGNYHRERLVLDEDKLRKEILLAYLNPNKDNVKDQAEMEKDNQFIMDFMKEYMRRKSAEKEETAQISAPVSNEKDDDILERYEEVFPKLLPRDEIFHPKENVEWPIEKSKSVKKDESPIPHNTGSNHIKGGSMKKYRVEPNPTQCYFFRIQRSISVASPDLNECSCVDCTPLLIVYKDYKDSPIWIDDRVVDSVEQNVKDENGNVPTTSVRCVTPMSEGDEEEMTPPKNNIDSIGPSGLEKPKRSSTPNTSLKSVQSSQDQNDIRNVDERVDDRECPWFPVHGERSTMVEALHHPDPKKPVHRKLTYPPKEPRVGATLVRVSSHDSMHKYSVEPAGSSYSGLENSVYELLDSSPEGGSSDVKVPNALISDEWPFSNSLVLPNRSSQNNLFSSTIPRCKDYRRDFFIPDSSGLFGLGDLKDRLSLPQLPVHNEISFWSNTFNLNLSKHDLLNGSSQNCSAASQKIGDHQNNLQNDVGISGSLDLIGHLSVPQPAVHNEISFMSNTSGLNRSEHELLNGSSQNCSAASQKIGDHQNNLQNDVGISGSLDLISHLSVPRPAVHNETSFLSNTSGLNRSEHELLNGSSQNCSTESDHKNSLQMSLGICWNPTADINLPNFESSNHNLHIELHSNTQPYSVSSTDLELPTLATNFQSYGQSPTVHFPSSAEYRAIQNTRLELGQSNILLNSVRSSGNREYNNSNPETSENIDIAGHWRIPSQSEFDFISIPDMINWATTDFGCPYCKQQIKSGLIHTNCQIVERLMKEIFICDESQRAVGFGKSRSLNTPTNQVVPPEIVISVSCFDCFCCRGRKLCDIKEICEESYDESDLSGGSSGYEAGSSESNDDSCELRLPTEDQDTNEYSRSNDEDMDSFVMGIVSEYLGVSSSEPEPEVPSYFASGARPSVNHGEANPLYRFNLSATQTMDEMGSSMNLPSWQTQVPFQNATFQSELPFFSNEHMVVGNASPVRTGIQVPVMQVCSDNLVKLFPEKFFKPIPPEIEASADISSEHLENQTIVDRTQYNSEKFTQTVSLSARDHIDDIQGDFGSRLEKDIKSLINEESDEVEDVDDAAGDGTVLLINEPTPWEMTRSIYSTPFCPHETNICEPRMEQMPKTGSNDPKRIVSASGDGCMPQIEAIGCISDAQDHFATVQSSLGLQGIRSCLSSIGNGQRECTTEQTIEHEPFSAGINEQQQQSPYLSSNLEFVRLTERPLLLTHNRTPQQFRCLIDSHRFEGLADSNAHHAHENQSKFMKLFGY